MGLSPKYEFWRYFSLVTELGLAIIGSILAGFAVGFFLDKWLNTNIIFTLLFLIFGVVGGFIAAYKLIMDVDKKGK